MQKRTYFLSVMATFATVFSIGQPYVHAEDTDVQLLDYLQDQKNYQRHLLATKELRELRDEISKEKLIRPIDPNKPAPVIFEGKDISYDSKTGDVYAKGNVKITNQYARISTDLMTGNSITGDVTIKDKTHMAQYSGPQIMMDGYNTQYNYNSKTGKMENAKGSVNLKYISGQKVEFYPEEIIVYNGTITRCPGKKPDYHMSADKIEIWPDDHMIAYNAKFWIKGQVIYKKDRFITKIGKNASDKDSFIPVHIDYNSDDGIHLQYYYGKQLSNKINAYINFNYYTKHHLRNIYGIQWADGKASVRLEDGYYEDSNDRWLKKEPTTIFSYNTPIANTPLYFGFSSEYGRWKEDGITSWHNNNTISLSHKTINLGSPKVRLYPSIGYSWVHESYDNSSYKSLFYNATIMADISPKLVAYTAYHYSQATTQTALFDYGFDDYSKKITAGFSYQLTDKDRIVVANEFDADDNMELKDRDYYWYHDFHCFDMALEYREKRQSWHVKFDLAHW